MLDNIFLRAKPVPRPVRCIRPGVRQEIDSSCMAIRPLELGTRWPACGPRRQRNLPGPLWVSTNYDVLHGVDGSGDIYSCFCSIASSPGLWGGILRYILGRISGSSPLAEFELRFQLIVHIDPIDYLCLRGRAYYSQTIRHSVCLYVLGWWHPSLIRRCPCCGWARR